ncbi:MAG: sugar phosphate nucleotidyltransferase [bacterium]
MKAVILAGGLGTRLRPLTCNVPKPMAPVVNRPILEHTLTLLQYHEIKDIIMLLFYLPEYIRNHFGDGSKYGVKISYITPDQDYGTAGAVKQAESLIEDTFLVVSGDVITDLDISRFVKFHKEKKALLTMALSHVDNPSPFGITFTDKKGRVSRFLEKPAWGQIFSDTVNMGIYVMEPKALELISKNKKYYFARDLFPKLLEERKPLFGYVSDCYWRDIGDLKTYQFVHWDWFDGKIKLEVKETFHEGVWLGKDCQIGKRVKIEGNVMLGDNCTIEDGVQLSNSVLGDNCRIGQNSFISKSILWKNVNIENNSELNQKVVGAGTQIG